MPFDINNPAHKTALASELNTDPQAYGYAPFVTSGSDGALDVVTVSAEENSVTVLLGKPGR